MANSAGHRKYAVRLTEKLGQQVFKALIRKLVTSAVKMQAVNCFETSKASSPAQSLLYSFRYNLADVLSRLLEVQHMSVRD